MAGGIQLEPRSAEVRDPDVRKPEPAPDAPRRPHSADGSPSQLPPPPPPLPPGRSRRLILRAAFALGAIGGTAAALAPIVRAGRGGAGAPAPDVFDEMYGGRHIQGTRAAFDAAADSPVDVRIDGRPLHVMRRADGSFLSVVNHYESFPTALAAARAAVDDLGGERLSPIGPAGHVRP